MPKEFDGAIGDKIVSWLEKSESWFAEREKVEGDILPEVGSTPCRLQGDSESLASYYGKYQVQLSRQELAMERPGDNYPYDFLFLDQMNQKVRGKCLEMPEAANAHKITYVARRIGSCQK